MKSLLMLIMHSKLFGWKHIYADNVSISMLYYGVNGALVEENEKNPTMIESKNSEKKKIIILEVSSFVVVSMLAKNESFDSTYFVDHNFIFSS